MTQPTIDSLDDQVNTFAATGARIARTQDPKRHTSLAIRFALICFHGEAVGRPDEHFTRYLDELVRRCELYDALEQVAEESGNVLDSLHDDREEDCYLCDSDERAGHRVGSSCGDLQTALDKLKEQGDAVALAD